ncbi:PHD finger protein 20-like protein 1 isoform X1 [Rana temporaria]|uniref:PHD finger protein 20-like protein 1 isoform X1 n=2 Tax=Rana temporaria TaxID=8407 RepID=UPI001AAC9406|nr:PHD finger protein 20-like protein 1 isoform X1 [Rana temporaria]
MEVEGGMMEEVRMSKNPPIRPGITFEIGARLEAQDYLQKWYPSKIEKMDYEEGKMLVHFERWSSRYDEWIDWDSSRIRPLERPSLRKEELEDEEENCDFNEGEEVLARWTDCRYYPAKIEAINKEGTYTVQFYDGVIRCLKKMHIKSMPEDARGQDWIALVKAAAAVVKNKATSKPRTSVNSNKDKEERKTHKTSIKREDTPISRPLEFFHKEEEPTSSQKIEIPLGEVSKLPTQQRVEDLILKRKLSQTTTFQAKRARLNKITGLLASKAVVLDIAEKKAQATEKPSKLQEAITPKPQTQNQTEVDKCHSGMTVTPRQLSPPMSSGKARSKKDKQELGDFSGCKKSPISNIVPQLKQGTPHNTNLSRSSGRNNRRRSQRLTSAAPSDFPRLPFKDGKGLPGYIQAPQDLSVAKVPDVAFVPQEKLEPLDLSCNTDITPVGLETTFHTERTTKEKEHLQLINYSSKALADGRIASTSSAPTPIVHPLHSGMALPNHLKPAKANKKKKPPAVTSAEVTEKPIPATVEKLTENIQDKIIKKVNDKEKHSEADGLTKSEKKGKTEDKSSSSSGKKKDKDKERKEKKDKEHSKSKQKKKKKKKKKSRHDYPVPEENALDLLERSSSPVSLSTSSTITLNNALTIKNTSCQFPRAILSVDLTGESFSEMDFLDDSSTESLILSGDEYNLEFDSTNFDESQDEEDAISEIVRCVCEMDEENGFMIQCEECLCWQHSVCMGLLEDSIPEQYICYVCSDPPGQRWSARYKYDKDWFNNGRMCGLSFINDNYSYVNTKKIVSTHHLLADVYGVTEILRGLQLKFGILNDQDHPDLRFWACPMKSRESSQVNDKRSVPSSNDKGICRQNHKGLSNSLNKTEDVYITSEHSYQRPQSSNQGGKPSRNTGERGVVPEGPNASLQMDAKKTLLDVSERRTDEVVAAEVSNDRKSDEQLDSQLQWQLNLLTHIESVQSEVTSRMDLIEKEVDVLESWLDFTGELEPPDPLARLPQLKRRIKQLLTDMGKVQQIATLCSV